MKSVLVLGGGGFIGVNLAKTLLSSGDYEVTLADTIRGSDRLNMLRRIFSLKCNVINADDEPPFVSGEGITMFICCGVSRS